MYFKLEDSIKIQGCQFSVKAQFSLELTLTALCLENFSVILEQR